MAYKILLVSSGQPSLNPRLVKEADALADAGHKVTVIYAYWNNWGTKLDNELLPTKKWKAIRAGGNPLTAPSRYLLSRVLFKAANRFTKSTGSMTLAEIAIARSSYHLMREAKKHHADLYIAHNLGALPAVVNAAKKYGKPCGFDAEDFHRNEEIDNAGNISVKLKTHIEDKYIPQLQYLTVSSPLIGDEYQRLYPLVKCITTLNTFPKTNSLNIADKPANAPIRLFWFSQTIGLNRGIEDMIVAIKLLPQHQFELHLLGSVTKHIHDAFAAHFSDIQSTIHFHKPIPSQQIIAFAAEFDIGIASEQSTPLNRDICLTNKLFTYIQAGLPLLVSDTRAQSAFMQEYQVAGKLYKNGDVVAIADILLHYLNNPEILSVDKKNNYQLGQTALNWDMDKKRFLDTINQVLPVE